jgi:hypothetical protein
MQLIAKCVISLCSQNKADIESQSQRLTAQGVEGGCAENGPFGPREDASGRSAGTRALDRRASARHGVSKVNLILGGHSGREANYTAQCGTLLPCTASPRQKQTERRLTLLLRSGPFTGACI